MRVRDKETRRQGDKEQRYNVLVSLSPLLLVFVLALGLRLLVWRWHEPYPLGGDESEYFNQALTLLREHRYVELKLMRPPLYTGFLAACMYLFDSQVQRLRLIQALIGALTVVPIELLTRRLFGDRRVALLAALLVALDYTLAADATDLLTETLFLFGLATFLWLLLEAGERFNVQTLKRSNIFAALAGLALGALALLRSVALPLLPLGALWLLLRTENHPEGTRQRTKRSHGKLCSLFFVLCSLLVILPWTARNYTIYGAPILIDTTGAENLWLDNDPAGREAVKQQLYALGDDRAARQRLALQRGAAVITDDPRGFLKKMWGEAQKFFALQYFDYMREHRAIWAPPLEVWLRLLLGDGLWLIVLLCGAIGLWRAKSSEQRPIDQGPGTRDERPMATVRHRPTLAFGRWSFLADPRWVFVPWALYTLLTALIFHVELRYRLPLYPVLLPYAAWTLTQRTKNKEQGTRNEGRGTREKRTTDNTQRVPERTTGKLVILSPRPLLAAITCLALLALTLLHRPYLSEAWMLAWKHARLWQAERSLAGGDASSATAAAAAALALDPDSALAHVALTRAALIRGQPAPAEAELDAALAALPAHPHAHLLRGALLRAQGEPDAAQREFTYETSSLEDLQRWSWRTFAPIAPAPATLAIGGGLDLGYVRGFSAPEQSAAGGFRWSGSESEILLAAPQGANAHLALRLDAGRPDGAPLPRVILLIGGREIGRITPDRGWHTYSLIIPPELAEAPGPLILTIRSDTFRPRDFDRASPDNRALGVMVGQVEIQAP